jgi:hypothetical protein
LACKRSWLRSNFVARRPDETEDHPPTDRESEGCRIIIIPTVVRMMRCVRASPVSFTAARAFRRCHLGLTFPFVFAAGVTQVIPAAAQVGPQAPPGAGAGGPEAPPAAGGPEAPAAGGGPQAQPGVGPDILPLVPGGGFGFPNPLNPPTAVNNAAPPVSAFS